MDGEEAACARLGRELCDSHQKFPSPGSCLVFRMCMPASTREERIGVSALWVEAVINETTSSRSVCIL